VDRNRFEGLDGGLPRRGGCHSRGAMLALIKRYSGASSSVAVSSLFG
jgi:hypothetical protein